MSTVDILLAEIAENIKSLADVSPLSATAILDLLKTVDGVGSGLDADSVDGVGIANLAKTNGEHNESGVVPAWDYDTESLGGSVLYVLPTGIRIWPNGDIPLSVGNNPIVELLRIFGTTKNIAIGTTTDITGATLQVSGNIVVSDAGSTKVTLDSTGRIIPTMAVGLHGNTSATVAHNTATNVARINIPGSPVMSGFLVQVGVNSTNAIKSALYLVNTAWSAEYCTLIGTLAVYGGGTLTITATTDTTNRYITLNVTHTNTAVEAATVYLTVLPLMCSSGVSLTMLV